MTIRNLWTFVFTEFFVAESLTVSAALSEFPIGNIEKVAAYSAQIDFITVLVDVYTSKGEWKHLGEIYNKSHDMVEWDSGIQERFRDLSRSRADLEKAVEVTLRSIMAGLFKQSAERTLRDKNGAPLDLTDKHISLRYLGYKWATEIDFDTSFFVWRNRDFVAKWVKGSLTLPEEAYKVDTVSVVKEEDRFHIVVPHVIEIRITVTDTQGQVLAILKGYNAGDYEFDSGKNIAVFPKKNVVIIPMRLAVFATPGEIRIWYTNGSEQVFSLSNGENLITYLSPPVAKPFRRLGVPKVTADKIQLTVEATDDEVILLESSQDLFSWELFSSLPKPTVVPIQDASEPARPRVRSITIPRRGYEFYRAEVVSPVAPAAPKQQ